MSELPKMQRKVYEQLKSFKERTGKYPELSAFSRSLGIHYVSLRQHLQALAKKGYVRFESRGPGQAPILSLPSHLTGVPVVGSIPAGPLSEAFEEPEGYLPCKPRDGLFALRVSGDSMAELIQDQDVVLLDKHAIPHPGDICAVRVGESDATLKYLTWVDKKTLCLRPHNPHFPTMTVDAREVSIEGVYLGLLRGRIIESLYQQEMLES